MSSLPKNIRYLSPVMWDRVSKLLSTTKIDISKYQTSMNLIQIKKDSKKFEELLQTIEQNILKKGKFNFWIDNIPQHGILRDTNQETRIGYQNIRDTMKEFGKISDIIMVQGKAYVSFTKKRDSVRAHRLINNMQMGDNIVTTKSF